MKHLLISVCILSSILMLFGVALPKTAYADCVPGTPFCNQAAQDVANAVTAPVKAVGTAIECVSNIQQCVINITQWVIHLILQVALFFVGITGLLLDWVVTNFVVGMGAAIGNASKIGAVIALGWATIRDLANIVFIAGLIYVSISMILQLGANHGKTIAHIIIAAVLVNFSYFFAGLIVDASNIVSRDIYATTISTGSSPSQGGSIATSGSGTDSAVATGQTVSNSGGIPGLFMQKTKLASIFNKDVIDSSATDSVDLSLILVEVLGILLCAATAWVFFNMAKLLAIRFVVIVILLILSPIGIVGLAGIGTVGTWGKQWWDAMWSQAIFPPVFFLLVGISYKIIDAILASGTFSSSNGTLADVIVATRQGGSAQIGTVAVFFLAIAFMWISLHIANSIANQEAPSLPSTKLLFGVGDTMQKFVTSSALKLGMGVATPVVSGVVGAGGRVAGAAGRGLYNSPLGAPLRFGNKVAKGFGEGATDVARSIPGLREGLNLKTKGERDADKTYAEGKKVEADILLEDAAQKRAKARARDPKTGKPLGTPADVEAANKAAEQLGKTVGNMSEKALGKYLEDKTADERALVLEQVKDDDKRHHVEEHLKQHGGSHAKSAEGHGEKTETTTPDPATTARFNAALDGGKLDDIRKELAEETELGRKMLYAARYDRRMEKREDTLLDNDIKSLKAALGSKTLADMPEGAITNPSFVQHVDTEAYGAIRAGGLSQASVDTLNRNLEAAGKGSIVAEWRATPAGTFDGV